VEKAVKEESAKLKLTVHDTTSSGEKSKVGLIGKEPFSFLGYQFDGSIVTVRDVSVERLRESLSSIFTAYKYSRKRDKKFLLWRLNLRITGCVFENKRKGWLFFFSEITDLDLLHRLDHSVRILCKRFDLDIKPKSFVRAFFQMKHHIYETRYIPNFDKYSADEMKQVLAEYFGYERLDKVADGEVEVIFRKKVARQVRDLETDLQDVGS